MTSASPWTEGGGGEGGPFAALKRHRAMRAGLVQFLSGAVAIVLGLVLPKIKWGAQISSGAAQPFLFAVAGGLIAFIALVFSLLFLMVQYATTIFTPRLTIFRDDPWVWRSFAVFIGTFVFSAVAGLQIGGGPRTSALVPTLALIMVLVSLTLARLLQMRALRLLQMNATLEELRSRGTKVLTAMYTRPSAAHGDDPALPAVTQCVRWPDAGALLLEIDAVGLRTLAAGADAVVRLHAGVGEDLRRGEVVFTVHGGTRPVPDKELLDLLQAGSDRTFAQDPLLAFRLLADIAIRALSPAINDPGSAVSAIAAVDDLLRIIAPLDLEVGRLTGAGGALRLVLKVPTWDEFLATGVDDIAHYVTGAPMAAARLASLLDGLADAVPPERRPAVEARRRRLAATCGGLPED